jgi:uncharacterized membrane protein YgcG
VSRRFRKLTRQPAAAPADARVVLDARTGDATCLAATAWMRRMTPRAVALEYRDANAIDPALIRPGSAECAGYRAGHELCAAVAKFARVLRLTGPFRRDSELWSQLAVAGVLTRLELHMPVAPSQEWHIAHLPDQVLRIASLRALVCTGGWNAIAVTSRQVAELTQLAELQIACVEPEGPVSVFTAERSHQGLAMSDANRLAQHGRLTHLRLRSSTERDMLALRGTGLGARLETLGVRATGRYTLDARLPTAMPALRRFETTWLADNDARTLAQRAPRLVALEIRSTTQKMSVTTTDDDEQGETHYGDEVDGAGSQTTFWLRRVIGISEPPAGAGLMRSIARHMTHLRELVLRRHHGDLRALSALVVLETLVCCDRPFVPGATKWPAALPALVDLRVIDISHGGDRDDGGGGGDHGGGGGDRGSGGGGGDRGDGGGDRGDGGSSTDREQRPHGGADKTRTTELWRRGFFRKRFPALAYLRFVRAEDEVGLDDGKEREADDVFDPVRRDPENGFRPAKPPHEESAPAKQPCGRAQGDGV